MAARRGKKQARRNTGRPGGLPGWAWLLLGAVLATVVVLAAPRLMDREDGDGFFRPRPNPDAQPAPASEDHGIAGEPGDDGEEADRAGEPGAAATGTQYDFYKLLPADEVAMTDAELAATERAEAERQARAEADQAAMAPPDAAAPAEPSEQASAGQAPAAPVPEADGNGVSGSGSDTPYILQAGAFGASGDAEAVKARIALLGLAARVESATIQGETVYRVRMGPYGTASELAEAKRKLASGGLPALAIKAK